MKKTLLLLLSGVLLFTSCERGIFGVDEAIWTTLSTEEREKVIDGYNKRKELELVHRHKQAEKELENEKHRQEIEAQTAPFYAAADAISSICGKSSKGSLRIHSISKEFGSHKITVGDAHFEISPFSKMSDAWVNGQKVQLSQNSENFFYPIKITNLDNGEFLLAKKTK